MKPTIRISIKKAIFFSLALALATAFPEWPQARAQTVTAPGPLPQQQGLAGDEPGGTLSLAKPKGELETSPQDSPTIFSQGMGTLTMGGDGPVTGDGPGSSPMSSYRPQGGASLSIGGGSDGQVFGQGQGRTLAAPQGPVLDSGQAAGSAMPGQNPALPSPTQDAYQPLLPGLAGPTPAFPVGGPVTDIQSQLDSPPGQSWPKEAPASPSWGTRGADGNFIADLPSPAQRDSLSPQDARPRQGENVVKGLEVTSLGQGRKAPPNGDNPGQRNALAPQSAVVIGEGQISPQTGTEDSPYRKNTGVENQIPLSNLISSGP